MKNSDSPSTGQDKIFYWTELGTRFCDSDGRSMFSDERNLKTPKKNTQI